MNDQTQPGYNPHLFPFTRPHDFSVPPPAPLPPDDVEDVEETSTPFNQHSHGGQLPPTFPPPYAPEAPYRPAYVAPVEDPTPASWPTQDTPQRVANANLRHIQAQPQSSLHRGPLQALNAGSVTPPAEGPERFEVKRGRKRGDKLTQRWSPIRQRLERMSVGDCEAFFVEEEGQDLTITQSCHERWAKNAGMDFITARGVFVRGFGNTNDMILVTRTA